MKKGKKPLKLRLGIIPFVVLAGVLLQSIIPTYAMDLKIEKPEQKYVPGEVLIKFKAGVSKTAKNSLLLRMGSKHLETLGRTGMVRVTLQEGQTVPEAIEAYKKSISSDPY